jgi:hypothetical protein
MAGGSDATGTCDVRWRRVNPGPSAAFVFEG